MRSEQYSEIVGVSGEARTPRHGLLSGACLCRDAGRDFGGHPLPLTAPRQPGPSLWDSRERPHTAPPEGLHSGISGMMMDDGGLN